MYPEDYVIGMLSLAMIAYIAIVCFVIIFW